MLIEEDKTATQADPAEFTSPKITFEGAIVLDEFLHNKKSQPKSLSDMLYVFRIESAGQVWHITKKFRDILRIVSFVSFMVIMQTPFAGENNS